MNLEERQEFWNTLANAKDENDIADVNSKIIYPQKIYRYRSMSIQTLNAIAENRVYFSSADHYDDPFDTFIGIKHEKLKKDVINKCTATPENSLQDIYVGINSALKKIREMIQQNIWSICFTEKYDNENLWLKYANNHKGIALEYNSTDFYTKRNLLMLNYSGKQVKDFTQNSFDLLPVVYRNEIYDATDFAMNVLVASLLKSLKMENEAKKIFMSKVNVWDKVRISIAKKLVHQYDEEWRLILNNKCPIAETIRPYIEIKPTKIILGLKISDDDKKDFLMAAEKAGIENIEQMIIDDNDEFVAQKILNP